MLTLLQLVPMANNIQSAKSGSDWTSVELVANSTDPAFMDDNLPADEALSNSTYRLIQYLSLATNAHRGQGSAADDFAKELLQVLGFEQRGTLLRSRFAIP